MTNFDKVGTFMKTLAKKSKQNPHLVQIKLTN